jgi:hypothetical protein
MGFKEAMVPLLLFVIAICGIAQSAITVNAYLTTNKKKDPSFNFSIMILVVSVCLLFGSGFFAYKGFTSVPEVPADVSAEMAAEGLLAGSNIPNTKEIVDAVVNIKGLTNLETARAAQARFDTAVQNTMGKLKALQNATNNRFKSRMEALQQAAAAMAIATETSGA